MCGCNNSRKPHLDNNPADTGGLKITDIASSEPKITDNLMIKNICIDCEQYEIPVRKFDIISGIWPILSNENLSFNSQKAFLANSFVLGFGTAEKWGDISEHLRLAGAKKVISTTMLFSSGQDIDIPATYIDKPNVVSYIDKDFSPQKFNVTQGTLNLRIKVRKPAGTTGICNLYGKAVHTPKNYQLLRLSPNIMLPELEFEETGFAAKMTQCDFLILAPGLYIGDKNSLTNLFFYKDAKIPSFKLYILFCSGIID